jgi:hypothetical protein
VGAHARMADASMRRDPRKSMPPPTSGASSQDLEGDP